MKKILLVLVILSTIYFLPHVAAAPSAIIQNDSSYVDSAGYYHIVGEISNTGDAWLQYIKITGTLKNAQGGIVDVTFTYTLAHYLGPGVRSPFDMLEFDKTKSAATTSYTLTLEFQQTTTPPPVNLVIQGANSSTDSAGYLSIVGQVQNTGPQTSNFTKVIASFYDASGKVIYVDFTYTSPTAIPAGDTYGFKILGPNQPISAHVAKFTLLAESNQYTSIAEFPWPWILMAAALTVGCVAVRRKRAATMSR